MTEDKLDKKQALTLASGLILIAALTLPLGLGLIYGAGVGWIAFGLLMVAGAYRIVDVAKKAEAKELEAKKRENTQRLAHGYEVEEEENARYGG